MWFTQYTIYINMPCSCLWITIIRPHVGHGRLVDSYCKNLRGCVRSVWAAGFGVSAKSFPSSAAERNICGESGSQGYCRAHQSVGWSLSERQAIARPRWMHLDDSAEQWLGQVLPCSMESCYRSQSHRSVVWLVRGIPAGGTKNYQLRVVDGIPLDWLWSIILGI